MKKNIKKEDGGPAFPVPSSEIYMPHSGMMLRDWFAGQALDKASRGSEKSAPDIARRAYFIANAMMEEREK